MKTVPSVTATGQGNLVEVRVHNQGKPIAPEHLPRLFEPFTRAVDAATADRQGLGLGLFIVSEIVRAHGGSVEAVSTAEEGTSFAVRLPRN